ncbi:hypothetical protein Q1695_012964 [Nippostrongylus brasiliensis]|nr:hypothetical protein Q1695_012964 [Nippostrongylus brasiliensis]
MYTYADTAVSYKVKKETLLETSPMNTEEKYTLIDAVRFYPELWDDRHLNSKDTAKRNQAWNFVVVEMQETHGKDFKGGFVVTVVHKTEVSYSDEYQESMKEVSRSEEVLARSFKNLKDTYRRKLKEINDLNRKASGCEASENVERIKAWPFFDSLSYLDVILDCHCPKLEYRVNKQSINS